ncbi:MAG: CDP-alcohol phosphatidyltransferase family protein [Gammaproteobacteria bacterium]|nr:CDP-alcohol phosphatidyltransferase family protein [Gammaproteobacteria bacterium]
MANSITLIRLLSIFVVGYIALYTTAKWQLLNPALITISVLLDGLDGFVARIRNETSVFGAVFDIAADRIIEITLWVLLAKLNMVSIWIAIIFLTRGILVDSLRKNHTYQGNLPFGIMKSGIGKFLVASRTMRFAYGFIKLITFSWLFFLIPASELWPHMFSTHAVIFSYISNVLVYTAVTICLIRGVPVIIEAVI